MSSIPMNVTRTDKGFRIEWTERDITANVGAAFTHVVLYSTGGWNGATNANDLPCFSKHKSLAAARKTAAAQVAFSGGSFEIVDVTTI